MEMNCCSSPLCESDIREILHRMIDEIVRTDQEPDEIEMKECDNDMNSKAFADLENKIAFETKVLDVDQSLKEVSSDQQKDLFAKALNLMSCQGVIAKSVNSNCPSQETGSSEVNADLEVVNIPSSGKVEKTDTVRFNSPLAEVFEYEVSQSLSIASTLSLSDDDSQESVKDLKIDKYLPEENTKKNELTEFVEEYEIKETSDFKGDHEISTGNCDEYKIAVTSQEVDNEDLKIDKYLPEENPKEKEVTEFVEESEIKDTSVVKSDLEISTGNINEYKLAAPNQELHNKVSCDIDASDCKARPPQTAVDENKSDCVNIMTPAGDTFNAYLTKCDRDIADSYVNEGVSTCILNNVTISMESNSDQSRSLDSNKIEVSVPKNDNIDSHRCERNIFSPVVPVKELFYKASIFSTSFDRSPDLFLETDESSVSRNLESEDQLTKKPKYVKDENVVSNIIDTEIQNPLTDISIEEMNIADINEEGADIIFTVNKDQPAGENCVNASPCMDTSNITKYDHCSDSKDSKEEFIQIENYVAIHLTSRKRKLFHTRQEYGHSASKVGKYEQNIKHDIVILRQPSKLNFLAAKAIDKEEENVLWSRCNSATDRNVSQDNTTLEIDTENETSTDVQESEDVQAKQLEQQFSQQRDLENISANGTLNVTGHSNNQSDSIPLSQKTAYLKDIQLITQTDQIVLSAEVLEDRIDGFSQVSDHLSESIESLNETKVELNDIEMESEVCDVSVKKHENIDYPGFISATEHLSQTSQGSSIGFIFDGMIQEASVNSQTSNQSTNFVNDVQTARNVLRRDDNICYETAEEMITSEKEQTDNKERAETTTTCDIEVVNLPGNELCDSTVDEMNVPENEQTDNSEKAETTTNYDTEVANLPRNEFFNAIETAQEMVTCENEQIGNNGYSETTTKCSTDVINLPRNEIYDTNLFTETGEEMVISENEKNDNSEKAEKTAKCDFEVVNLPRNELCDAKILTETPEGMATSENDRNDDFKMAEETAKCEMDLGYLDRYIDKSIDQIVPDDSTVHGEIEDSQSAKEEEEAKLYACDVDICDDIDRPVCKNVEKKVVQGDVTKANCFKWKYAPSCDLDNRPEPSNDLDIEDQVVRIMPLKTCGKPIRIGLSKRQSLVHLHKNKLQKPE